MINWVTKLVCIFDGNKGYIWWQKIYTCHNSLSQQSLKRKVFCIRKSNDTISQKRLTISNKPCIKEALFDLKIWWNHPKLKSYGYIFYYSHNRFCLYSLLNQWLFHPSPHFGKNCRNVNCFTLKINFETLRKILVNYTLKN